jgi:hypothetical protein
MPSGIATVGAAILSPNRELMFSTEKTRYLAANSAPTFK